MACLLKTPDRSSKGVVVFTTQERDNVISADPHLHGAIGALKGRWVVGLHHNWHDHGFVRDELYDFSMAGEGDLIGDPVPLVTLDACNFVPPEFRPGGDPFWDLLYVARPVFFKGLDHFLDAVRALYDEGRHDRVLCVCPMPPFDPADETTVFYGLEDAYLERFSPEERRLFTLLVIRRDYPFPLDLPTLAHLYRSSRAFAHFAPDERRCRVAAYAWATGLPVAGTEAVGSLLPAELRRRPAFYEVDAENGYAQRIAEALDAPRDPAAHAAAAEYFSPAGPVRSLAGQLGSLFPGDGLGDPSAYSTSGLGIRLGRHHGISSGPNRVPMSVAELVAALAADDGAAAAAVAASDDPEMALAERLGAVDPAVPQPATTGRRSLLGPLWRR
jgi:glycosyltransferase involved in cell wall biosynthesis